MQLLGDKIIAAAADLQRLNAGWYPTDKDLMDAVGLENWSILRFPDKSEVLLGSSIDHPQLGSRHIHTSNVLWISDDRKLARTLSRWYRLGSPAQPSASASTADEPDIGEPSERLGRP